MADYEKTGATSVVTLNSDSAFLLSVSSISFKGEIDDFLLR
jgi:hypothetical protein